MCLFKKLSQVFFRKHFDFFRQFQHLYNKRVLTKKAYEQKCLLEKQFQTSPNQICKFVKLHKVELKNLKKIVFNSIICFIFFLHLLSFFLQFLGLSFKIWKKKKLRWGEETDDNNNNIQFGRKSRIKFSFMILPQYTTNSPPLFFLRTWVSAPPPTVHPSTLQKSEAWTNKAKPFSYIETAESASKTATSKLRRRRRTVLILCFLHLQYTSLSPTNSPSKVDPFLFMSPFFYFLFLFCNFLWSFPNILLLVVCCENVGYRGNRTALSHYHAFSSILLLMSQWVFFLFSFPTFSWQPNRVSSVFGLFWSFTVFSKLFFVVSSQG